MPTKTEQYLGILARGGDVPTGCCMTNEQRLIAEAIDRINNMGGGGLVLSVREEGGQKIWYFENSDNEITYDGVLEELKKGTQVWVHNPVQGTYQLVDYWGETTNHSGDEVLRLTIENCYGALSLRQLDGVMSDEELIADSITANGFNIDIKKSDNSVSGHEVTGGTANNTVFVEFGDDDIYIYPDIKNGSELGIEDFYDDPIPTAKVLAELVAREAGIIPHCYDDAVSVNSLIGYSVKNVQKNNVSVQRVYVIYEGITSIEEDGSGVERYTGVLTVDTDDGSFAITKTPFQNIPDGENMEF